MRGAILEGSLAKYSARGERVKRLATIDVGDGHEAAIIERDDGSTRWTPGLRTWLVVDPPPSFVQVPRGTLIAGAMLPGSSSIEVRGAEPLEIVVAGGQYLALVAGKRTRGNTFILFRHTSGEIVRREPGEVLKLTSVPADVECPACGGTSWDKVEWRADPDAPTARVRAVVCRLCGHYEGGELVGRRRRPEPEWPDEPSPLREDPSAAEIIAAARFPVYISARPPMARPARIAWGSDADGLVHVSLGSSSVLVESYRRALPYSPAERARMRVVDELMKSVHGSFKDDIDVAMLERREARRRLEAAVDAVASREASLVVSGRRRPFVVVEHEGRWAAGADGVVISGYDVAPADVALRRLRRDDELSPPNVPQ